MKSLHVAAMQSLPRFVAQQIHYSLEAREAEYELSPIAIDQGAGMMVWGPLTSGLLSELFSREMPPKWQGDDAIWNGPPIRDLERLWTIVDLIKHLAEEHNTSMAQIALAWVLGVRAWLPSWWEDLLNAISARISRPAMSS